MRPSRKSSQGRATGHTERHGHEIKHRTSERLRKPSAYLVTRDDGNMLQKMTSDQDVRKRNQEMLIFQTVLVKPPHTRVSVFEKENKRGSTICRKTSRPLHFGRCMLRAEHSEPLLDHPVELRIDWHPGVGAASCGTNSWQISVNNKQAGHR